MKVTNALAPMLPVQCPAITPPTRQGVWSPHLCVCAAGSSEEPWSRGQFMTNVQSNNAGPRSGVCYICSFVKENKNMVKIYYRHFSSSVWKALRRVTCTLQLYRYMVQACVVSLVHEFLTEYDNNNCLYQLILLLLITEAFRQNYYA